MMKKTVFGAIALLTSFFIFLQIGDKFKNPIISDYTIHDASFIRWDDKLYLFTSCLAARDTSLKIKYNTVHIFEITDLQNWKYYKRAIGNQDDDKLCDSALNGCGIKYAMWAPDIIKYQGKLLLFVALHNSFDNSKIAVFESDSINKDFRFKNIVVSNIKQDGDAYFKSREIIDPYPFIYNDSLYLTFGSFARNGNGKFDEKRRGIGTYIVPLEYGNNIKMKAKPVFLTDYYEGVNILQRNDKFILFGTNGAWTNHTYKIEYATSNNLYGPYKNHEGKYISDTTNVNLGKSILYTNNPSSTFNGFGCMSHPIIDKDGRYWVLVHGHDLQQKPITQKNSKRERYIFLIELLWDENDNPYFDIDAILNNNIKKPNL